VSSPSPEFEPDLSRLEAGLRQLKIQYDMFFAGAIPRQPIELRSELERTIKLYSNAQIRNYATRFHLTTLVSKFNSMTELWAKMLRATEEGNRPAPAVANRAGGDVQIVATCRVRDARQDVESLRLLHARFQEMRRKLGDTHGKIGFESFLTGVASQASRLREKSGCEEVELRLVVQDRKVQLKARPSR
jgi:hypothetical protein